MGLDESGHHSPDEAEAISEDQPGDLRNPTPKQNGPFAVIAVILWASNDEDHGGSNAATYSVKFLGATTWTVFVQLVERHNGIWGGCWCLGFHQELSKTSAADNRAEKERLVMEGRAHAALVYVADVCVGWCQFGRVAELPNIKYRKAYDEHVPIHLIQHVGTPPDLADACFRDGENDIAEVRREQHAGVQERHESH